MTLLVRNFPCELRTVFIVARLKNRQIVTLRTLFIELINDGHLLSRCDLLIKRQIASRHCARISMGFVPFLLLLPFFFTIRLEFSALLVE